MTDQNDTLAVRYLKTHGPSTGGEIPTDGVKVRDRELGARAFQISLGYRGGTQTGGGQATPIYYIDGEHDPEDVIRAWASANELVVENQSPRAVHHAVRQYSPEFREASKDALKDVFTEEEWAESFNHNPDQTGEQDTSFFEALQDADPDDI